MTTTMEKTFNIFDTLIGVKGDKDFGRRPVIIQGITGQLRIGPYQAHEGVWDKHSPQE